MVEYHTIQLDNQILEYQIHYKNIKHCYLKIEKGKVIVSASPYFSIQDIEKMIQSHQDQILNKINNYHERVSYKPQGFVYLFDKYYRLRVFDMNRKQCVIHDNDIYIYSKNIQATLDAFLKQELYNYIYNRIQEYLNTLFNHEMPEIQIKKMKRRWGACFYTNNRVCFNFELVHLRKDLIDYVIIHELCHFIEANHTKRFYHEIEIRMKDYRLKERELKDKGI